MKTEHKKRIQPHRRSHHSLPENAKGLDLQVLWATLRRSWVWALPVGLILAAITAVVVLQTFVPRYRASHWIEANNEYLVFKGVNPVYKNLVRSEKPLILNSLVLDPVLANPDLRWAPSLTNPDSALANLKKQLSFSGSTSSRLCVSYEDTDPKAAAAICNAIVDSYLAFRDDYDSKRVSNIVTWLEPEISRWEQEVENQRSKVKQLKSQTVGYSQDNQVSRLENNDSFSRAAQLYIEIGELELEIAIGEANLVMLSKKDASAAASSTVLLNPEIQIQKRLPTEFEIEKQVRAASEVIEAKAEVRRFMTVIKQIEDSETVGIYRKKYNRFQQHVSVAEAELKRVSASVRNKVIQQLNELNEAEYQRQLTSARNGLRLKRSSEYSDLANQIRIQKSKLAVLQPRYQEAREELAKFGGATAELEFASSELEVSTEVLNRLRGRSAEVRTERRPEGSIRSLVPATIPTTPVESVPYKKLLMASSIATLFPFLLGLLLELKSGRISDSAICDNNGLEVLGEVARLPAGDHSSRGRRVFEESIDTLRAGLFLSLETRQTRSLAVISSMSGEGKSSVSSQLALSIAKATGKTVLLVDADLRCPDQHHIFGLDLGPGLTGVLTGTASLKEAVDRRHGNLIHILPAGKLTESPHRLLSADKMSLFVEAALKTYAYVVIDTSPVLSAGESIAVASATDAALLCVMRDVSRMDSVKKTQKRLQAAGANLVGTVFSGVSARQYAYRYGDYHYNLAGSLADRSNHME